MCLYSWDYTNNHNKNEDENENRSHRSDLGLCIGLDMETDIVNIKGVSMIMLMCMEQHLSNIWRSIQVKVKQLN